MKLPKRAGSIHQSLPDWANEWWVQLQYI